MKKRDALLGAALVGSLIAVGCGIPEDRYVKKVNEAEQLRQDLEGARGQLRALDKQKVVLDATLSEKGDLQQALTKAESRVVRLEDTLANRGREIAELGARVQQLESERAALSGRQQKLLDEKRALEQKTQEYDALAAKLKEEVDAGRIELTNLRGRMAVKLSDKVLFASGSARIRDEGRQALAKLAEVFKTLPGKALRVEGHTDNVPVAKGGPHASNWDLSSARSLAVVNYLQEAGIDAARLSAEACGQYRPIASNDTPEGRAQNRRIEIVIVPLAS
ncbi:MAG: OmpA family protein [Deltaproteobacteria bacterium]|nr:OmpA family protein [Deltaproteobacteria bacterium]